MSNLSHLRDIHFMGACRQQARLALSRGEIPTQAELIRRAVMAPAPGYYVEFEYALKRLYTRKSEPSNAIKRAMWREIASKVERLMSARGLTRSDALQLVLASAGASRFFINPSYAAKLYQKRRRRPL